jgi:tetratricopeptide (TPR) repeat protein
MLRACVLVVTAIACSCAHREPASADASAGSTPVPLFEGLGAHSRAFSGATPEAQKMFDQGLAFLFGFNHDQAIRSFHRAADLAPDAAMPWWGVAVANGPHINFPAVPPERAAAAWKALAEARARVARGSPVERALVEALEARHADPQPGDRKPLDEAYAAAMRKVWQRFPQDDDVGALFAEALMDLRPWDLWTAQGEPQPGTEEVLRTLETVLGRAPRHPLAAHLYIHAVEASPHPDKADAAADALRDLQPGLGHMVHMPSHIDVRRGRWEQAIEANDKAMATDRAYRSREPRQDFYRVYMAHNHHMRAFAAMMLGRSAEASRVMTEMVRGIPPDWAVKNAGMVDGFMAMPVEVLVRFGKWDEVLAAPDYPEHFPIARALRRAARGVAYAAKERPAEARQEHAAFVAARDRVPADASFGNNGAGALLDLAQHFLEGEILFREGKVDEALAELRRAVELEDGLRYNEPPDWIVPVRHALGATLLQAGRHAEAEQVYRDDLVRLPHNGWSLFGLGRALRLQGKDAEAVAVERRFQEVWAKGDVPIKASCFCQKGV